MGRNKETMKRVLKFISPYKSKIIIMLLTALVTVGFTLYTPILIGNGVDNIVGPGNVNTAGLLKVLGALAVIVVGNAVSQFSRVYSCFILISQILLSYAMFYYFSSSSTISLVYSTFSTWLTSI